MTPLGRKTWSIDGRASAALVLGLGALASIGGVIASLLLGACDAPRFPVCSSNEECLERDAGVYGTVCYNLRCVECHYDGDCDGGRACNSSNNECQRVTATAAEPGGKDDGHTEWSHGSWGQCAADCKDPKCIKACDEKFQK